MFVIRTQNGIGAALAFALLLAPLHFASANISIPELPTKKSDNKKLAVMPPQPVPVVVEVTSGGTVQIPLRVYGKQEQATAFLVRKEPELGKVVSVAPVEGEVSVLTYTHTSPMGGQARAQDKILFAAQNKNGTSAAVEIVINIVDVPPQMEAPGPVEFGNLAAGLPATRVVTVSNKGGGLLEGTAAVDPPWTVAPHSFKLRQGEKASFRLTLVPAAEQEYQGRLHFITGDTQAEPPVHANAFAPFTVGPAQQTLQNGPNLSRSGKVTLTNRTSSPLGLRVEANPRLHLPGEIVLPPGKSEPVAMNLGAEDPEGIETAVAFTAGAVSKQVRVLAQRLATAPSPTPAIIAATPAPLAAADAPFPKPGPPPPVNLMPPPPNEGPGVPPPPDENQGAPQPPPPMAGNPRHASRTPDPADLQSFDPALVSNMVGAVRIPILRSVTMSRATTQGTAELSWPAPKTPGANEIAKYRVELRRLVIGPKDQPIQQWLELSNVAIKKAEGRVTALLSGIRPGAVFTVHVLALNEQGGPSAVSTPVRISIPIPQPILTLRRIVLLAFTLVLIAALGVKWTQARRNLQEKF